MNLPFATGCLILFIASSSTDSCSDTDDKARGAQEKILDEANSQLGMPAIHNFYEKRIMKEILEKRDQANLSTYTYLVDLNGKLHFFGNTIGYGLPYATQYTNPLKDVGTGGPLAQADPNGLFSPSNAEGTWVLMKNPSGKGVEPVYVEPRIIVSPFPLPCEP